MHVHISGIDALVTVLEVIVVLGTLNLVAQHYKTNPSKIAGVNTFWSSYDELMNNTSMANS